MSRVGNIPFFENGSGGPGSEHTSVVYTAILLLESRGAEEKRHFEGALNSRCDGRSKYKLIGDWNTCMWSETEARLCRAKDETGLMCKEWHQTTRNPTEQVQPHTSHSPRVLLSSSAALLYSKTEPNSPLFHLKASCSPLEGSYKQSPESQLFSDEAPKYIWAVLLSLFRLFSWYRGKKQNPVYWVKNKTVCWTSCVGMMNVTLLARYKQSITTSEGRARKKGAKRQTDMSDRAQVTEEERRPARKRGEIKRARMRDKQRERLWGRCR